MCVCVCVCVHVRVKHEGMRAYVNVCWKRA